MEERVLGARQPDDRRERDGGPEERRPGDVRLQVGQDHAGEMRQPFGHGGIVPVNVPARPPLSDDATTCQAVVVLQAARPTGAPVRRYEVLGPRSSTFPCQSRRSNVFHSN